MNTFIIFAVLLLIVFGVSLYFIQLHYKHLLKKEVKRAQKSERIKSMFIENVSHTLRAPIKAISGYCDMILEEKDEEMQPAQVRELVTNMSSSTQQLLEFISQLYDMTKLQGITPSFTFIEVNLSELMASYRRETMNITKPDVIVRVTTDLSPHCKGILDTNLMHQLMMHLLTNAAHHITGNDIVIKYAEERKGLKVTITYAGQGQADILGADIYSYLQKEDALMNANDSSAFGLSVCKAIVDMLGGEFYVDTEYDKKTVTCFWIPCKMRDTHKDM
jgi:K+-sensing histidine kinase KdpD